MSSNSQRSDIDPVNFDGDAKPAVVRASADFYREGSLSEAERLRMMAEIADNVSIDAISKLLSGLDTVTPLTLDIGAGDSLSLGLSLRELGQLYIPVDTRKEVIETHRRAGFDAFQAMATKLPFENGNFDVAHSRFTWGWLSSEERLLSLAEMLRVSGDQSGLTVIDYDWSVVDGPKIFLDIIEKVKDIMRQTGFDPDYGSSLPHDIEDKLGHFLGGGYIVEADRAATYSGPIDGAYAIIEQTAQAIIDQLRMIGSGAQADELASDLALLQAYIAQHPEENASLPEIVSTRVAIDGKSSHYNQAMAAYLNSYGERRNGDNKSEQFTEGKDYLQALPDVRSLTNVGIAKSKEMISSARMMQAVAYVKDGIVGFEAIGPDGTLSDEIDPPELVNRSVYFTAMHKDQRIGGMIRIIRQDDGVGVRSLPTLDRLYRHSPKAWQWLQNSDVMAQPDKIIEVSGLAKNMLGGSFEDTVQAMLVMSEFVRQNGYNYGIMGLQESKLKLIEGIFGNEAIQRVQGEDAEHPVDLPGVKDSIHFIPLYVDAKKFAEAVSRYAGGREGKLFDTLAKAAQDVIDNRAN